MTLISRQAARRLAQLLAGLLLCLALSGLASAGNASAAEGFENYCSGAKIPEHGICRGPFVQGLDFSWVEEYKGATPETCTAPQDNNGKWYNVYGWVCGSGSVFDEFPATSAYPTIDNPNYRAQWVRGLYGVL